MDSTTAPFQVIRCYNDGGVTVIAGHLTERRAAGHAFILDAVTTIRRTLSTVPLDYGHDIRRNPRLVFDGQYLPRLRKPRP